MSIGLVNYWLIVEHIFSSYYALSRTEAITLPRIACSDADGDHSVTDLILTYWPSRVGVFVPNGFCC